MATFDFTPSFEATESSKPRVRRFQAGDGYEQRVRFGLNTDPKEWTLTFSERSDTERDQITAFLDARGGFEAFDWTTPRGVAGKFVCEEWQVTLRACNFNTITATFRQVFEPG
jgi:phage-related protein